MLREFLEVLVWIIPIVAVFAAVAIVALRVGRRGPMSGPHQKDPDQTKRLIWSPFPEGLPDLYRPCFIQSRHRNSREVTRQAGSQCVNGLQVTLRRFADR